MSAACSKRGDSTSAECQFFSCSYGGPHGSGEKSASFCRTCREFGVESACCPDVQKPRSAPKRATTPKTKTTAACDRSIIRSWRKKPLRTLLRYRRQLYSLTKPSRCDHPTLAEHRTFWLGRSRGELVDECGTMMKFRAAVAYTSVIGRSTSTASFPVAHPQSRCSRHNSPFSRAVQESRSPLANQISAITKPNHRVQASKLKCPKTLTRPAKMSMSEQYCTDRLAIDLDTA